MLYEIQIANSGKGEADIRYRFEFTTKIRNPKTFLYNTGQIADIADQTWNRPQFYSDQVRGRSSGVLTGIPPGVVKGFQNYTGTVEADMLRLNLAIPPAAKPNDGGLVAGDAAGFPNGRRISDVPGTTKAS